MGKKVAVQKSERKEPLFPQALEKAPPFPPFFPRECEEEGGAPSCPRQKAAEYEKSLLPSPFPPFLYLQITGESVYGKSSPLLLLFFVSRRSEEEEEEEEEEEGLSVFRGR